MASDGNGKTQAPDAPGRVVPPAEVPPPERKPNRGSRQGADQAGWSHDDSGTPQWTWSKAPGDYGDWSRLLRGRVEPRWRSFSWLSSRALLDSANDQIAKLVNDLVGPRRQRWVSTQRANGIERRFKNLVIDHSKTDARSFLILGDPGEADGSQYALVEPMLQVHKRRPTDFMVVMSDVIYPAGDVNDYVNGFYVPYADYKKPIYGLPGNHDWYDGLNGFMFHFCGAEPLPPTEYRSSSFTIPERFAQLLWRRADRPNRTRLLQHRDRRDHAPCPGPAGQPGPYFVIDLKDVRLIAIDTGIGGTIDAEQGRWLVDRSRERPDTSKVLLTGKPIWVDGEYRPTPVEWDWTELEQLEDLDDVYETVDDIVRDASHRYVAAIGGDVHNYQRYDITVDKECADGRTISYIVSGGAGAFMSATHSIPRVGGGADETTDQARDRRARIVAARKLEPTKHPRPYDVDAPTEEGFRCYPSRGDSMAYYTRWFGRRMMTALALLTAVVAAGLAAAVVADATGWDGQVDGRPWGFVYLATIAGPLAAGVFVAVTAIVVHSHVPKGYRTISTLLVVPVLAGAAAVGLAELWPAWSDWIWQAVLLTFAVVALPLAVVLVGYYGVGSGHAGHGGQMVRHLTVALLVVAELIVVLRLYDDVPTLALAGSALLATWVLMLVVRAAYAKLDAVFQQRSLDHKRDFSAVTALVAYGLVVVPLVYRFWDHDSVHVMITGAVGLSTLALLFLAFTVVAGGGVLAVPALVTGRVDPNHLIGYVWAKYKPQRNPGQDEAEGKPDRAETPDWAAKAVAGYLLPAQDAGTLKRIARSLSPTGHISEVGNADTPPMFKNFLHAEVREEGTGKVLEITCYGVTGWKEHESNEAAVPREDTVTITLAT